MAKSSNKAAPAKGKGGAKVASPVTRLTVATGQQERSVDIRKIENGYIVRESSCGPRGYKSSERFTPTAPKIDMPGMAKPKK